MDLKIIIFIGFCFIILLLMYIYIKKNNASVNLMPMSQSEYEASRPRFRILNYQEALEASKQFIYDIARLVLQKFTPNAQKQLLEYGKTLFKAGVKYLHVVDVLSLSNQKQKQLANMQQQRAENKTLSGGQR